MVPQDKTSITEKQGQPIIRKQSFTGKQSFGEEEVGRLVERLVAARPDLAQEGLVERAGVSRSITTMLGNSRHTLVSTLTSYLDKEAFTHLEAAVSKVEEGVADMGARQHCERFPLHVTVLTGIYICTVIAAYVSIRQHCTGIRQHTFSDASVCSQAFPCPLQTLRARGWILGMRCWGPRPYSSQVPASALRDGRGSRSSVYLLYK